MDQSQSDDTAAAAPLTIRSSSVGTQTRGTHDTHSTTPTSISDSLSRKDFRKQADIGQGALGDNQEQEEDVLPELQDAALPGPEEVDGCDGHSLASQGSTVYKQ